MGVLHLAAALLIISNFTILVVKHEVPGVVGESVSIPCNCSPTLDTHPGDKPVLIIWYKDNAKLPIYR